MPVPPYPLQLVPAFRDYLWGGRNLASRLGKAIPETGVWAESWEVVDHAEHESVIANGPLAGQTLGDLMRAEYKSWLIGESLAPNGRFPLLLKYLDCQRVLSVQVHPDDAYALQMVPPDLGKTEAWYIISAEPGSVLYAGLKPGISAGQLRTAIDEGRAADCLHTMQPQAGDCVFIPAGTVHALGAGLMVAEIQQASNTTFRLYDWDRVDANGQSRPLHIAQSLENIDFDAGPRAWQSPVAMQGMRERLVECDKFCLDRFHNSAGSGQGGAVKTRTGAVGGFQLLTVPEGLVRLSSDGSELRLTTGQSVLLPAALGEVELELDAGAIVLEAS